MSYTPCTYDIAMSTATSCVLPHVASCVTQNKILEYDMHLVLMQKCYKKGVGIWINTVHTHTGPFVLLGL
jgi:hypothetical protein